MYNDIGGGLSRLSMSLPSELSVQLDAMVAERGLPSRSQLLSELIRQALVEHHESKDPDAILSGTVTAIYQMDVGKVRHQIAQKQVEYHDVVVSSQHVIADADESLEVFVVRGPAQRLRRLCDELRKFKGINQVHLVTGSTGVHLSDSADSARQRSAKAA